jgi:hypothetical protein
MCIRKETSMSKDARVRTLIAQWSAYRGGLAEPARYDRLKSDLYCVRNPGFNGCPASKAWPPHLVDPDDEVMAAVEHYFLTRSWVGSGQYPAWEVRALRSIYDLGKRLGVTPRHNPGKPVTPPSEMQKRFQDEGIRDGEADRSRAGGVAPLVGMPPKYY